MSRILINKYYQNLERAMTYGKSSNEMSIRNHFWNLLNEYAHDHNYEVIPEVKPSLAIQGNTPKDTVINPELVIVRQPVIIKENKSTPEPVKQSEKTEKE